MPAPREEIPELTKKSARPAQPGPVSQARESSSTTTRQRQSRQTKVEKDKKLSPVDAELLRCVNAYRKVAGLPNVTVDPELSRACRAHASYLVQNAGHPATHGLGVHDEEASLPGFSEAGRAAAKASVIITSEGTRSSVVVFQSVDGWMATFFHRIPLINPDLKRVGIGCASNAAQDLWRAVLDAQSGAEPDESSESEAVRAVLFPSDKQ
jgi:uncharacterized protein YkwD